MKASEVPDQLVTAALAAWYPDPQPRGTAKAAEHRMRLALAAVLPHAMAAALNEAATGLRRSATNQARLGDPSAGAVNRAAAYLHKRADEYLG